MKRVPQKIRSLHLWSRFWSSILLIMFFMMQSALCATLVEVDQDRLNIDLSPYVDILEDASGKLTIDDVVSEKFVYRFASVPITELFFGYTTSAYWLRFTVENQRDTEMHFVLSVSPVDIDYLDMFAVDTQTGEKIQQWSSGSARPFESREYDHPLYFFDLPIKAHTAQSYYLRVQSNKTVNLVMNLSTSQEHLHGTSVYDALQGALMAGLLLLALIYLLHFFLFRSGVFLWYGLFLLSVAMLQICWDGYLLRFFQPNDLLLDRQILTSIYLGILFSALFAQSLLETRLRVRWQHHVLSFIAAFCAVAAVATWFVASSNNSMLAIWVAGVCMLLIFVFSMYAYLEDLQMAKYFLLARTMTSIIIVLAIFNVYGYLPQSSFTAWGAPLAMLTESIILLFALTYAKLSNLREKKQVQSTDEPKARSQRALINLADICHELRTPISGVLGMSDLLLDGNLSEQQRNQVKTVRRSGQSLLDITHKIADLSAIESGKVELNCLPFDLASLVEFCIENCRARAESNNIELIYLVDNNASSFVRGDQEKLQQVLINLLQFALRHLEMGEIFLTVSPVTGKQSQFHIRTGHNTLQECAVLAGSCSFGSSDQLNLTIAEQYIHLMGGELAVQQYIGGGVSISFSLALEPQPIMIMHEDSRILDGKRLLVVDDNSTCCAIIEQQATQWGMQVSSAQGGKEALAILRSRSTLNEPFDIVLVDYDMPSMTGLELAAHIRMDKNIDSDHLLIIMLTGVSKAPSKITSDNTDIQRVLYKPLSGKSLKQALRMTLAQHLQTA